MPDGSSIKLTDAECTLLLEDRDRWERMGKGAQLDDWLAFGEGLLIRRRLAMKLARVNQPKGKRYVEEFHRLLKQDSLHSMDATSRSAVLWSHEDPERINILREIRETMTVGQLARFNSPITAKQRVQKILKARAAGLVKAEQRASPVARLREKLVEKERENADLTERLTHAEYKADVQHHLCDPDRDSADDIAKAIHGYYQTNNRQKGLRILRRLAELHGYDLERKKPVERVKSKRRG